MKHSAKQIKRIVEGAQKILLIPHQNPDPDALGSVLSFYEYLKRAGKQVNIFCQTDAPTKLNFLPHFEHISRDHRLWEDNELDTICVFDSGDPIYAGIKEYLDKSEKKPTIINIDHHKTNIFYGDYNIVDLQKSSTCEIIYYFYKYNDINISPTMATNIIAGIMSDTDNFTNAATQYSSLLVTGELIKLGGKFHAVKSKLYNDKSMNLLRLWGEVLARLQKNEKHDIVYMYITNDDLKKYNLDDNDSAGLANFMNNIGEGSAGLILKEKENGKFRGSLRTTLDHIDVSAIAQHFGGGGHKKAAGFEIDGPIEKAFEIFFEALEHKPIAWKTV